MTLETSKSQLYMELSILKVCQYLKKQSQKVFNIWRRRNSNTNKLQIVLEMLESKKYNDINFAFTRLQQ